MIVALPDHVEGKTKEDELSIYSRKWLGDGEKGIKMEGLSLVHSQQEMIDLQLIGSWEDVLPYIRGGLLKIIYYFHNNPHFTEPNDWKYNLEMIGELFGRLETNGYLKGNSRKGFSFPRVKECILYKLIGKRIYPGSNSQLPSQSKTVEWMSKKYGTKFNPETKFPLYSYFSCAFIDSFYDLQGDSLKKACSTILEISEALCRVVFPDVSTTKEVIQSSYTKYTLDFRSQVFMDAIVDHENSGSEIKMMWQIGPAHLDYILDKYSDYLHEHGIKIYYLCEKVHIERFLPTYGHLLKTGEELP